jgi:hypothetical protein
MKFCNYYLGYEFDLKYKSFFVGEYEVLSG